MSAVLVVEDDPLIGQATELWLARAHRVQRAGSLEGARARLAAHAFDVVLLDLGLPDGDGLELLAWLAKRKLDPGIIVMTARGDVESRVRGLDLGADDYLVKPFDFKELDARMRSVTRRRDGTSATLVEHGALVLDVVGMTVTLAGDPIHLSQREVAILAVLLQGRGRHFSSAMLVERVYGEDREPEGNAVEVHVSALRRKLGRSLIRTTRGLGYIVDREPVVG